MNPRVLRPVGIAECFVGPGSPCFIIAEAGVNHNGDPELAMRLVDAAAEAGANAVKFQTFQADRVASAEAPKAPYQETMTDGGEHQRQMLRRLELPTDVYGSLRERCMKRGLLFMSTPFDEDSVDLLDEMGVPAFKVGSGEITNLPFLEHVARKGRPIILSTGMSFLSEVDVAVRTIRDSGNLDLILLHCVSAYPANPAEANLKAMNTLKEAFGVPVGFSDHTLGIEVAIAAAALGAAVIEKHFTIDRNLPGPDHRASLEPGELQRLVRSIRTVEAAIGSGQKRPVPCEGDIRRVARRSLHLRAAVEAGTTLNRESLVALRPAGEIGPEQWPLVCGRRLRISRPAGAQLRWSDLE